MDAIKFIDELNRMCKSHDNECTGCPLIGSNCPINDFDVEAEKVVLIVEKWSKERPKKKTNGDMIKALLPKERKYTLPFKDIITINLDKDWWDAEYKEENND